MDGIIFGLSALCAILGGCIVFLSVKLILIRREIKNICAQFSQKLETDTNTLISVSPFDPCLISLANSINVQLRALRRERRRLSHGDRELKAAIADISHDLRTPLTAVCGYLELLEKCESEADFRRYTAVVRERAQTLKELTEELFSYAVAVSPQNYDKTQKVCLNSVLEESIAAVYAQLTARGIVPNIKITQNKITIESNRAALLRIFENILSNAVKYSDGDLDIELANNGEIIFSNTARGMNEIQAGRLFDRFFTLKNADRSTGLGLSIAKVLTGQLGGKIFSRYLNGRLYIHVIF